MIFAYEIYGLYLFPHSIKDAIVANYVLFSFHEFEQGGAYLFKARKCVEKLKTLCPIISFSHVLNHEIFAGNSYFNARISQIIKIFR